ncbi:PAS domain-containing protein [Hirschia litorea]|uniref:PAS domain-containing protein n=1 Tax=Hirschia litorea TaxID=1199156 RepID=A0ABW2IMT0_9PROT
MTNTTTSEIFKSSRNRDLSSPALVIALYAMAFVTCFMGLALFVYLTGQKIAKEYSHELRASAQIGSLKIENLLSNLEKNTLELAPLIREFDTIPTSSTSQRDARRAIFQMLKNTPIKAVMLKDEDGNILLQISETTSDTSSEKYTQTPSPLQKSANLLEQRLDIVRTENDDVLIFQRPSFLSRKTLIFVLDDKTLANLLIPQSTMAKDIDNGYLIDKDNNILSKYGSENYFGVLGNRLEFDGLNTPISPLEETQVKTLTSPKNIPFLTVESGLSAYDVRVIYTSSPISSVYVLRKAGLEVLTFIGPGILGLLLTISLIQNEWHKSDRRRNNSADALARAEIASDMLQAGIIDWNVKDASVIYSQGWHNLYEYAKNLRKNEIYDHIDRIHPDDIESARNAYQNMLDGKTKTLEHTLRIRNSNGEYLNIFERCSVRQDHSGTPKHVILVQSPI